MANKDSNQKKAKIIKSKTKPPRPSATQDKKPAKK